LLAFVVVELFLFLFLLAFLIGIHTIAPMWDGVAREELVAQSEQNKTRLSRNDMCDILELTLRTNFQRSEFCDALLRGILRCTRHHEHERVWDCDRAAGVSRSAGPVVRRSGNGRHRG
jgi:hypothetical protein